ncbi:amidase domain-containing protein [Streptomyces sp. NPDC089799]|uniref:amidase domain-containing protein n=1 Tax=Streptomyces sp. NPDC089799 TaxID=3155066 RepID=UPI00341E44CE
MNSTLRLKTATAVVLTVALSAVLLPAAGASAAAGAEAGASASVDAATKQGFASLADAVLTKRTSALLDGPRPNAFAATPPSGPVSVASGLASAENGAVAGLLQRRARLAELKEAYTAAKVDVDVDSVRVTGARAKVRVTETTELTYKKIYGDEPPNTGFQAQHELTFTAAPGGTWQLTGITPLDQGGPSAINAPDSAVVDPGGVVADAAGQAAATTVPARPEAKISPAAGYNYGAMAKYAEKYWKNYNPSYRKFNDVGGDCTNFISQSLRAGGWKNDTGWYKSYKNWWYNSANQTTSWVNVNYWASFALYSKRTHNLSNVYYLGVGDILQMDFSGNGSKDHSMITTYRSSRGVPYLTYHSNNTYRKSVASIVAQNPRAKYYAFRT